MSLHDSLRSRAIISARTRRTRVPMAPAPNANNSVFFVPADGSGAAAYMERRLRHVPDLWAPSGKILLTH